MANTMNDFFTKEIKNINVIRYQFFVMKVF